MKRAKPLPSQEYLHECFIYTPDTGALIWKYRPFRHFQDNPINYPRRDYHMAVNLRRANNNKPFGNPRVTKPFYISGVLDGEKYLAHKIIWKMQTGDEPDLLDHKDRDGFNNKWDNLRIATESLNNANTRRYKNNTSGYKGVQVYGVNKNRYLMTISHNGLSVTICGFPSAKEAKIVYDAFAQELFGDFWNPG